MQRTQRKGGGEISMHEQRDSHCVVSLACADHPRIGQEAAVPRVSTAESTQALDDFAVSKRGRRSADTNCRLNRSRVALCSVTVPEKAPFSAVVQFAAKEVRREQPDSEGIALNELSSLTRSRLLFVSVRLCAVLSSV